MKTGLWVVGICVAVSGCASRNRAPDTQAAVPPASVAPYAGPVCMLKAPLPVGVQHASLGRIQSGKQWYGGTDEVVGMLADAARANGADAVVNLRASHKFGMLAWARPVAAGDAVRLASAGELDCKAAGGEVR
ncbi:hypothetical protein D9M68_123280 [compost metagenome]